MKDEIFKFKFFNMPVSVRRSVLYGSLIMAVVVAIVAVLLTSLTILDAIITGIIAMLLHWLGEITHQYGHYIAAKRVKYPASGLTLFWILGGLKYPKNEYIPSPQIHIWRAMGGPIISFILALVITVICVLWLLSYSEFSRFIAYFILLEYWLIFTIGAVFPPLHIGWFKNDGWIFWENLRPNSSTDITPKK